MISELEFPLQKTLQSYRWKDGHINCGNIGGVRDKVAPLRRSVSFFSRRHPWKQKRNYLNGYIRPLLPAPFGVSGLPFGRARCLQFDILGDHFGTPGAPWMAILAPWDRPGKPWQRQVGHKVVRNRMTESTPRVIGVAVGKR